MAAQHRGGGDVVGVVRAAADVVRRYEHLVKIGDRRDDGVQVLMRGGRGGKGAGWGRGNTKLGRPEGMDWAEAAGNK